MFCDKDLMAYWRCLYRDDMNTEHIHPCFRFLYDLVQLHDAGLQTNASERFQDGAKKVNDSLITLVNALHNLEIQSFDGFSFKLNRLQIYPCLMK